MENAVEAMKMAFGMIVFVIAFSASMYLLNTASSTSRLLLYYADETNYIDNININTDITRRTVDMETIIPTLYRYYKENFAVHIYNKKGTLVQIFDVNIEGKLRKAAGKLNPTQEEKALVALYGNTGGATGVSATNPYLFEAPWIR